MSAILFLPCSNTYKFCLQGINPNVHPKSASYYLKVYLALSLFVMAANVLRDVVAVWGATGHQRVCMSACSAMFWRCPWPFLTASPWEDYSTGLLRIRKP